MVYQEFSLPYTCDATSDSLYYLTIDFEVRGRVEELTTSYSNAPMNEEACREIAEDLEENYEVYFSESLIMDAYSESGGVTSVEDLKKKLENGCIRFIF